MRPDTQRSPWLTGLAMALVLGIAATTSCGLAETRSDTPAPLVLESYQVPVGYEGEIRSTLRSALGETGGRVSVGPSGTILVLATQQVQRGVKTFIDELAAKGAPPATPQPVTMSYWIVLGAPATGDRYRLEDVALKEIEPALAEVSDSQGPQRFKLLERAQLASAGDDWDQSNGRYLSVEQRVTLLQDVVVGNVRLRLREHNLATEIKLEPGQIVVLGQTGVSDWTSSADFKADTLYYVITSRTE
jgi:hypothetical protein